MPSDENHQTFLQTISEIYPEGGFRKISGHEPAIKHLEGCYTLLRKGKPVGRFAFYVNSDLRFNGLKTSCFGSYECADNPEYSKILFDKIRVLSKEENCEYIIGPMEGSTWQSYRFTDQFFQELFMTEPYHHEWYGKQLSDYGFEKIGKYHSYLDSELRFSKNDLEKQETQFKNQATVIRNLDKSNLKEDLEKIGKLSITAFQNNFLYSPISVDEFVKKYEKIIHHISEEFIWLLEDGQGELQAFLFAFEDLIDPKKETVILKTVAKRKDSPFKGIGAFLTSKLNQEVKKRGFKKIIHAFMYAENDSLTISEKFSTKPYKSHSLYGMKA